MKIAAPLLFLPKIVSQLGKTAAVIALASMMVSCLPSESVITRNSNPGIFIDDVTLSEGQAAVFPIKLTQAYESDVTVSWTTTTDGTAIAGDDFVAASGTVTIPKGDIEALISVATTDDILAENPETILVTLLNPVKAVIIQPKGTATVNDNDLGASLSINDVTFTEGGVAIYTVTASQVSGQDIYFDWSIQNATTVNGDFSAASGQSVLLPAGALTTTFSIASTDDSTDEETENFNVVIGNPVNASLLDNVGAGSLVDNDLAPNISISDAVVVESGIVQVTVSLDQLSGRNVSFDWVTASGTAQSGTDFTAGSGITIAIPAGQLSVNLNISTLADLIKETDEYFDITISNATNAVIADAVAFTTIQDNNPTPALSVSDASVIEGASTSLTISLNVVSGQDVTVDWATSNNTAISPGDYTAASGTVTIPASSLSTTVTIASIEDFLDEAAESFSVTLSNQTNAVLADPLAAVTIIDDDAEPSLSVNDVSITESGSGTVTVSLNTPSDRDVSFNWATTSGTAISGVDFTPGGATAVVIPAGSSTATFTIHTIEDAISETAENLTVTLSSPTNATINDNTGIVTINDNDATPSLNISDATVTEGGNLVFTVSMSSASGSAVTFDWATANNTAVAPGDYTADSGTYTIAAGATSRTITINAIDDVRDEAVEDFNLTLSNPSGATLSDPVGVGTLIDNDSVPTISISDATATEGGTASLTITLSAVSERAVSFDWATSNNTAFQPSDYTQSSATAVTIAAGATSTVITVPTIDDIVNEGAENFNVSLSSPLNATIADGAAVVTINDNESAPALTINDVTISEGGTATFTISISQASGLPVTVDWASVNGTATAPTDLVASSGVATIAAGSTSTTVNVTIADGTTFEVNEQFSLLLSNPLNATITDATGVATIIDNDVAPSLVISDVIVTEGASAVATVTLTGGTQLSTTVAYSTSAGTAVAPLDYASAAGTLTFPAGTTTQTITIATINDTFDELTEAFTINLSSPTNSTISDASSTVTVSDNDAAPAILVTDSVVSEGGTATFTVSLTAPSELAVSVDWASAGNTAISPADYTTGSGTVTIAAGATSATVNIVTATDALSETTETFFLNLTNPSNATITDNQGLGSISDGNSLPTLAINDVTVTEAGTAAFTVTLSQVSAQDVTFNWVTSNNTATAFDYTSASGTGVTIPAGSTTATLNVVTLGDMIDETSESFFVTVSVPTNSTVADSTGVGTISDDDATPTLSVSDIAVAEGGTATFTVTLSAASGLPVTFDWSSSNGTGIAPGDFTLGSGSLSISAGSTSVTFNVVSVDDSIDEANEIFSVNLANVVNASLADGTGVGTINDNDLPPSLSIGNLTVTEGGTATFTVTASAVSGFPIAFDWTSSNGTAVAPGDFTSSGGAAVTIAAGATTANFAVVTINDVLNESTESFTVNLSAPVNASLSVATATVNLTDNDAIPTLSVSDVTIAEGGTASFTVTLSAASSQAVAFDWTTNSVTASSVTDFTGTSATGVVIPAGSTTVTLNVASTNDTLDEPAETFEVLLTNVNNATFADATGVGTITDNDAAPSITIGDVAVTEGGTATFTVTLSTVSGQSITVDWASSNNTALAGIDYTAASGTATIAAGSTTTTFNVVTLQDTKYEVGEGFNISLTSPVNATIADSTAIGTISDNDAIPTLSIANLMVAEGGTATFTVTLSAAAGQSVTVDWATANATAVSATDYTTSSGTLTILEGATTATMNVVTTADVLFENDETFNVQLTNAVSATIATGLGTATITDNDSAPTISVNDVTLTEGGTATFTVTLSAASGKPVSFDWISSNGTAFSPGDYTSGTATGVTIAAGMTSTTINLVTIQDVFSESSEAFSITLSNPVNATISDSTGVATVTDDDSIPTLSINDISVAEGGTAVYTVTLSAVAGQAVTMNYAASNGSAVAPNDFTAASGTLTIPAGSTVGTINVTTIDDSLDEPSETYTVNLSSAVGATLVDSSGAGTVTDNDGAPTLTIDDVTVTEAGTATFTVSLSTASGYGVSVDWATATGTAVSNTDFSSASGTAVIAAGSTSTTFTVATLEDSLDEFNETFVVNLTNAANATILDSAGTGTIGDNDAIPTIAVNNVTTTEGGTATFTVTLSTASGKAINFDWASSDLTAVTPGDYTAGLGTVLTIAPGATTQTFNVVSVQDTLSENNETFNVTLTNPVNATISTAVAVGTITDDETNPTLTIANQSVTEGSTGTLTVTLSSAAGRDVTVNWASAPGTAIAGSDYTTASGTLTIAAGSTTGTVQVMTTDDSLDEPVETLTVVLSSPSGATIAVATGTLTVNDNDSSVSVSVNDVTVVEGVAAGFTVSLSAASGLPVSVDWATSNGTAVSGSDYTAASGTVTIPVGSTTATVSISTTDDALDEVSETLNLTFSNPTNATIADNLGIANLTDNDAAPSLSINNVTVTEGTSAAFTVTLSSVSGQAVAFDWSTAAGTALTPGDFTGGSLAAVTIAAGSTTATVTIPTINDTIYESAESFTVVLSNPVSATISSATGTATVNDNDTAPSLAVNDVVVTEGGTATFTVTLTGATEVAATVNWASANSTANSPADYTGNTGSVTINPGSSTATFNVVTVNDAVDEVAESFNITLSGPTAASISDGTGVATINDDDAAPNLSINDVTITEGGSASFTVTLSAPSERTVTFDWASSNNTAVSPADYTAGSATGVTIAPGNTTATITILTIDDAVDEATTETMAITVGNVVNANNIDNTGVGSITDNDASPTLSIANVSATESGLLTFTITQSAASQQVVTVAYASSNASATAGVDYTAISGTATIIAGATTTTLTIATIEDTVYEGGETINVTLSSPVNATIVTGTAVGTINENEMPPTIAINDVALTEGSAATFTVSVTGVTAIPIQFDYATANGTAVAPGDFGSATSSMTIPAGSTTATINITTIDDAVDEPSQAFTVVLSNPTGATISDATGVATIADNDASPSLSVNSVTVTEGTTAAFTVTLSAASEFPVTFDWTTSDGLSTAPSDFVSTNGFGVTIAAGSTTSTLNVVTINDIKDENVENFSVTISNAANATIVSAVGVGTVNDNDATPTLTINDVAVTEGGTATFVVNLSAVSELSVSVDWNTLASTATTPADYTAASGTLTIPAGNTSGTMSVTTINNTAYENSETFSVNLANALNSSISDGTGVATINDNDSAPTLAIDDVSIPEGGTGTLTVTVTGPTEVPITFNWATSSGTAVSPGDFAVQSGTAVSIAAGATNSIINVTTIDDALNEATESLSVVLSAVAGASFADNVGVITVLDNDSTTTLSVNDVTIVEGVTAAFTVSLNTASGRPVSFNWATSDGTATSPGDYTANSGTATIPAGSTTTTINITTVNDLTTCEIGDTFNLVLSAPVDATITDSAGVATITDNDPTISLSDATATEGASAVFTATLSASCSVSNISFTYATTAGTATATADYTTTTGTGTILAGATTTTISVPLVDDSLAELAENLTLTLSAPVNAIFNDPVGVGTITDNDTGPNISIANTSIVEGTALTYTVTLSAVSGSAVTVNYTTSSGTAISGTDFTAAASTLVIPAGSTTGTISVTTTDDTLDEANETVTMTISAPTLGTITGATATGTITDNDPLPTVAISSPTATEVGPVAFTITLSAASGFPVTVDYATSAGTAGAGTDYTTASGTATIPAGSTTTTVNVSTVNDTVPEASEAFTVTLSNPTNATLGGATGTGTITDDDTAPNITINDPAAVAEGAGITFTISLSAAAGTNISVNWVASGGSAVSGTDYTAASGTATITAGATSTTISVTTLDDAISEAAETFNITLSAATFGTITDATGVGSINSSDGTPTIAVNDVSVAESAGTATFTVTLSNVSSSAVGFTWASSNGTATSGTDYTAAGTTETIPAGSTTATFNVAITNDTTYEPSETFNINLSAPSNATISDATGVGTITDNDTAPTLSINDVSVTESGIATFTITQSAVSGFLTSVDWATSDGTALVTSDYTAGSGTRTIAIGSTSTTLTVATVNNAIFENSETFNVILSNALNATIADNTGIATVTDEDAVPSLSINDVSVAEGGTAAFTVTLSAVSAMDVTFNWATSSGTAVAPGDYSSGSATAVTILAGATTATVNVTTLQDALDEPSEAFTVTLSTPSAATISDNVGIGTITDDDATPTIAINNASATEGGNLTFTVTLSAASGQNVTFDYATSNVTATSASDYTATSATAAIIPAGATTSTITVVSTNDAIAEAAETMNVTISNPINSTISTAVGVGTINDNDTAPTISINSVTVVEGVAATLTITASAVSGSNITFDWATSNNTATAGTDYTTASGTATITAGATTTTVNVVTADDLVYDGPTSETVNVTISNPTNATIASAVGIVTLTDNEPSKLNGTLQASGDVQTVKTSPDSSIVVYLADETSDGINELYSVNVNGSSKVKLNAALVAGGNVLDYRISADSSRVVYLADQDINGVPELFSVAISGGVPVKLNAALSAGESVLDFELSPDSARVVYIADETTLGKYEIYSVGISGASPATLNAAMIAGGDATAFAISPDSTKVVYRSDLSSDDLFELYSVNIDGTSHTKISTTPVANGDVTSFKISPDSVRAVYVADTVTDERYDLRSVTLTGSGDTIINGALTTGGDVASFDISANSSKVVYLADQTTDNVTELYSSDLAGGSNTKINGALVAGGNVQSFAMTPNSSSVVYLADLTIDSVNELFSVSITGTSNTKLNSALAAGREVTGYKVSASSAKIVYRADETSDDVFELYSVNLNATSRVKISGTMTTGGDAYTFVISANSASVAYVADQSTNNTEELYKVAIGGGTVAKVNATLPAGGNVSQANFTGTNDSSQLVYIVDQVTDELFELFTALF